MYVRGDRLMCALTATRIAGGGLTRYRFLWPAQALVGFSGNLLSIAIRPGRRFAAWIIHPPLPLRERRLHGIGCRLARLMETISRSWISPKRHGVCFICQESCSDRTSPDSLVIFITALVGCRQGQLLSWSMVFVACLTRCNVRGSCVLHLCKATARNRQRYRPAVPAVCC